MALVAAIIMSACGGPRVLYIGGSDDGPGDSFSVTGAMNAAQPKAVLSVTTACLKKHVKPQTIESVEPLKIGGGLKLTGFTVVPTPADGASDGFLRRSIKQRFHRTNHTVSARCNNGKTLDWIYIEVSRPTSQLGSLRWLKFTDESGHESTVHFSLTVCRKTCPADS